MKFLGYIFLFILFFRTATFAQADKYVTVTGYAPKYIGKTIRISEIVDFLSMKESTLASATVKADSTFTLSFELKETQKAVVHADKNNSFLYLQPGGKYTIYLPEKDKYDPLRPNGSSIEVTFLDLDTNDINFKILQFQRWSDEWIGNYFYLKNVKPLEFSTKLDEFKTAVEKFYHLSDTTQSAINEAQTYFNTFVRFSIASLDNIQHAADRNRYEKHDFYLKFSPVFYRNDAYMGYLNSFYEKMIPRLSKETNNKVYLGLLKSSPTLIMKALGNEYTLINMRIREIVMIKALSEIYYSNDYPQTNILAVLDSVSNHSLFNANAVLARNMMERLTELTIGGKAPDLVLHSDQGEVITLSALPKKHIYLHFYDPTSQKSAEELVLLRKLHETYKEDVTFISVYPDKEYSKSVTDAQINSLPWIRCRARDDNPIWKNYKIATYPTYVLLDGFGYVVAAPALTPLPDGQYQTIDKTFYYIQKANKEMNRR
ncbi:MAG: hypothetical protein RIT43_78 [Bacteroidota bacterium]